MEKLLFTKYNFENVIKENKISLTDLAALGKSNETLLLEKIIEAAKILQEALDIPSYIDIEAFLLEAVIMGFFNDSFFVYDPEDHSDKKNSVITINTDFLDLHVWENQKIVQDNLNKIINSIQSKSLPEAEDLIRHLQSSSNNYPLVGGNICSPKKYIANSGRTLPKGITVVEIRVNSESRANYRIYGILKDYIIYLLKAYTKNSGQVDANSDFDAFMDYAKKFIENNKLAENLLYNNRAGGINNMNTKAIFEELDMIYEQQALAAYNNGWNDYFNDKKITEGICLEDYNKGWNDAEKAKQVNEWRQYAQEHRDELFAKLKAYSKNNQK